MKKLLIKLIRSFKNHPFQMAAVLLPAAYFGQIFIRIIIKVI